MHGCCLRLPAVEPPGSGVNAQPGVGVKVKGHRRRGLGIRDGGQGYALGQTQPGIGTWYKVRSNSGLQLGIKDRDLRLHTLGLCPQHSLLPPSGRSRENKAGGSEPGKPQEGAGHSSATQLLSSSRDSESPGLHTCPASSLGCPAVNKQTPPPSKHHLLQAALPQPPYLLEAGVGDPVAG